MTMKVLFQLANWHQNIVLPMWSRNVQERDESAFAPGLPDERERVMAVANV